jgi:hypothetical protein
MPIDVVCEQCGWKASVKNESAGKKGKCPTCGEPILVPRITERPEDVEDAAAAALLEGDEGPAASPPQSYMPPAYSTETNSKSQPSNKPERPRSNPGMKLEYRAKERHEERRGIAISGGVWAGLLMMGGAAIWFFLGLAAGRIFFYPPILFVLGIISLFRALSGNED